MAQKSNESMQDLMVRKMAETLRENIDEIASVLRVDVGSGDMIDKVTTLFASVVMDRLTGRMLDDPSVAVLDMVRHEKENGRTMPALDQKLYAGQALEVSPYWCGHKSQSADNVLWQILLQGRFPHEYSATSVDAVLGAVRGYDPGDDPEVEQAAVKAEDARMHMRFIICEICGEKDIGQNLSKSIEAHMQAIRERVARQYEEVRRCDKAVQVCIDACRAYDAALRDALQSTAKAAAGDRPWLDEARGFWYDGYVEQKRCAAVSDAMAEANAIRQVLLPYLTA